MIGFYGHWPRIKFGMHPAEGGIAGGKAQAIEPALVTTYLRASPDGTIEHQAEFLPTQTGQIAEKLYAARTGGFSSAIDQAKPELFGFDYVLEPNFTSNRGYTLDSVLCEGGACAVGMDCDAVNAAILDEQVAAMARILDATNAGQALAEAAMSALETENAQLKREIEEIKASRKALDSARQGPLVVSANALNRLKADTEAFLVLDSLPFPQQPLRRALLPDPAVDAFLKRSYG
ncbi:MAG: hypothetical protein EOM21_19810 [Gammaproteobacteria bacterium]|nr:hypothetical protein [Gammaproteobacteria bacterium]